MIAFITEWNRYMYHRLPQGFLGAANICTGWYDEILKNIDRKVRCVGDTLSYDHSIEEAFFHTLD